MLNGERGENFAAIVNAHDALLARIRVPARARASANLVAVDFYGVGDLVATVRDRPRP